MKKIFVLFFVSFFVFSCSKKENLIENLTSSLNTGIIENSTSSLVDENQEEKLKYFTEDEKYFIYDKENYKFKILKEKKFSITEDYFETQFFVSDENMNNFSFSISDLSKFEVKTIEEFRDFILENLRTITKNPDIKAVDFGFKGLKGYKISYNAGGALIEENIFLDKNPSKIIILRTAIFDGFEKDDMFEIMNSFEVKK